MAKEHFYFAISKKKLFEAVFKVPRARYMIFIAQLSKALAQKWAKISRVAQSKPLKAKAVLYFFLKHSKTIRTSLSVDDGGVW